MPESHILIDGAIVLATLFFASAGFVYGLTQWLSSVRRRDAPLWRRLLAGAGLFAILTQLGLFVAYWAWPRIGREPKLLSAWARWTVLPFIVALPCTFAAKGSSRWWLLASSLLLFVICFFIVVTE